MKNASALYNKRIIIVNPLYLTFIIGLLKYILTFDIFNVVYLNSLK